MKIVKLYGFLIAAILFLDALVPHSRAYAWFPHGSVVANQSGQNACGVSTNNWCVGSDGWTLLTASQGSGTCGTSSGNYTGSCLITVTNETTASYTGHVAVAGTLVIDSAVGTSPAVGQTAIRADGTRLGTITGGSYPNFTLTGAGSTTFTAESMTSSIGNDTTCRAQAPPSNPFRSTDLSTYTPSLPCYTQSSAAALFRSATYTQTATITATMVGNADAKTGIMQVTAQSGNPIMVGAVLSGGTVAANTVVVNQLSGSTGGTGFYTVSVAQTATATSAVLTSTLATSDWFLVKKGTTWTGMMTGGNILVGGKSNVEPLVLATYGTGSRPLFKNDTNGYCFKAAATRGLWMAMVGFACQADWLDPSASTSRVYTITADAGTSAAAPCSGANVICNTTIPALVQSSPTSYRAYGTGISGVALTAATGTTATLASNPTTPTTASSGQMSIQLVYSLAGTGMVWLESTLLIYEDNRCDYCALSVQPAIQYTQIPQIRIRRSILASVYIPPGGGSNIYTDPIPFPGSAIIEETVTTFGGYDPQSWAGPAFNQYHNLYLHNPSVGVNVYSNVVAYDASDNQYRDGGNFYNNLVLYHASAIGGQIQNNPATLTYNVIQNANRVPTGQRVATAADGSSGSVLHVDGVISALVGTRVANLSNPTSIQNGSIDCLVSSIRDAVSVNLSCTLAAGIRGNGVQIGDVIRFSASNATSYQGVTFQYAGLVADGSNYPAYSSVSVSAASPSVITDPSNRAQGNGEPFSFTPVIVVKAGTGYGASATGTLTWAGAGCSVNPVINVSTNAAGNIVAFNSITTAGTCGTPPPSTSNSWTAGGGLSAGSGVQLYYNMSMGTLPTGVSLANDTGGCTGTLVTNTNSGRQVCTYYALASGTSYQFSATPGGAAINASGSGGTTLTRTGASRFVFPQSWPYNWILPPSLAVGTTATPYESGVLYMGGPNGRTYVKSISGGNTLIMEDGLVSLFSSTATFIFGTPMPCSIEVSCFSLTVGPNNIFSHPEYVNFPGDGSSAIQFNTTTSGAVATGNYIFNWNTTTATNTSDLGIPGTNTLVSGGTCISSACVLNTANETRFPKANIEYYDASQLEVGNTFSGYIDNGAGGAGYILTVTSGSPSLVVPLGTNGGYGDTVFDTTAAANVVTQYTRIVAQIDATHYLVNVSQAVGSSGAPIQIMYGSADRFLQKAKSNNKETGWVYAYTAQAANDYIRQVGVGCGNQSTFPGAPGCPLQGQTIH